MPKTSGKPLDRAVPYMLSMASIFFIITAIALNFNNCMQEGTPTSREIRDFSSVLEESESSSAQNTSSGYILREYNGKVGVFSAENDEPVRITEIEIAALPKADAALLKLGIFVEDEISLQRFLEDYES